MPHSFVELTENALPALVPGRERASWAALRLRFRFRHNTVTTISKTTAKTTNPPTEIPITTGVLLNQLEVCEETGISVVYALVERLVAAVAVVAVVVVVFSVETESQ